MSEASRANQEHSSAIGSPAAEPAGQTHGKGAMTIRYGMNTPGPRAQYSGVEIDDDFTAVGWQTDGDRVGRFRRALTAAERRSLERALQAARRAGPTPPAKGPRRPGAGTERIIADGVDLTVGPDVPADAAELVDRLRDLQADLTDSPVGAIALEVTTGPRLQVRLRHVGAEPVGVQMTSLTVSVAIFGSDSALVDTVDRTVDASDVADRVAPGWTLAPADDLDPPAVPAGGFVTVTVTGAQADVLGDGIRRAVEWGWVSE